MNKELIKQLAQKAGAIPIHGEPKNRALVGLDNIEKLVELMLLECVNAVMDGTKEGDHYAMRIEQHFDKGQGGILHFGVEE